MNASQILSADLLDLVFDDRNKDYGAYELRKTYPRRIKRSLLITTLIISLIITGALLAGSLKQSHIAEDRSKEWILTAVSTEKVPDLPPPPKKQPPPPAARSIAWTTPKLVDHTDEPPPAIEDVDKTKIDVATVDGPVDDIMKPSVIDSKGIFEEPKPVKQTGPVSIVQVQAKFNGNWEKFLKNNLKPERAIDNGAPAGRHRVIIQFVVDADGTISDIRPLTNLGYGMEEEAMRVIKKSDKWEPAIQDGYKVKAYRQQPIIFEIADE